MTNSNERHRLSLIIATLGPSTDNEKELITMLMAGIARQWTDGVDIARILHSDGEDIARNRIDVFRSQSKKRNLSTQIYLDTDSKDIDIEQYINFANSVGPDIATFPKSIGIENFSKLKDNLNPEIKISLRLKNSDSLEDLESYYDHCAYVMMESSSQDIVDNKMVEGAKSKNVEPIYLAKMPTLMKGQVQSREENFEIGHITMTSLYIYNRIINIHNYIIYCIDSTNFSNINVVLFPSFLSTRTPTCMGTPSL